MKFYLKDFCIFLSVAETLSLSQTASDLGMSISSVSKRLSRLEDYLNTTLFERTTRGVKLSPLGEKAYFKTKKMTHDFSDFIEGIRGEEIPCCNILINSYFKKIPFTEWLFNYNHENIDVSLIVNIVEDHEDMPLELQDIVISNIRSRWPYAINRRIGKINRVSVKSNLNSFDDLLFPKDVCTESIIYFSSIKGEIPQVSHITSKENIVLNSSLVMNDVEEIINLVINNDAIAVGVPFFSVKKLIEEGLIVEINTEWNVPPVEYFLAWRERNYYKPGFEKVLHFIENEFKKIL